MIKLVNVTHHYGIRPSLKNINLEVSPGELVCVMGPNGMGKTTMLGIVAGVLYPLRGYVEINGKRRRGSMEEENEIRKIVAYLPDHPWLPLGTTGREFLLMVGRFYGIEDDRLMDHVDRLLALFNMEEKGDSPIESYSNGQKKKIAVAGALATEAPILILDEPFSGGLDPSALLALKRVLERLAEREDITVLMATPVPELVEGLANRIAILKNGEIIAYDTSEGLRDITRCSGPLEQVLEKLMHEKTLENVDHYIKDWNK